MSKPLKSASISILKLPNCNLKGKFAESLAGVLAQCPALAHLDLSDNYNFGAPAAKRLAGVLGQCRELVHLNLSDNNITAAGAESLARVLSQCPALAHLDLCKVVRSWLTNIYHVYISRHISRMVGLAEFSKVSNVFHNAHWHCEFQDKILKSTRIDAS
jgi:Leucine-rich repeat (LRR) protein